MVQRNDGVVTGFGDVVEAFDFEMIEGAEHDREEIGHPVRRHGETDSDGHQKVSDADERQQYRHCEAEFLQNALKQRSGHHEQGVEHIDARHHAGAAILIRPGLDRGECGHDEEAAADGESGKVDQNVNATPRRKVVGDALTASPRA